MRVTGASGPASNVVCRVNAGKEEWRRVVRSGNGSFRVDFEPRLYKVSAHLMAANLSSNLNAVFSTLCLPDPQRLREGRRKGAAMNSPLYKLMLIFIFMLVPARLGAQQTSACAPGQAKVVQVVEDGSWETAEGRTIRTGQCISIPASVEAGATGSITFFFGGSDPMPKTYSCENEAGCRVPVSAPPKVKVDPVWKARAEKIAESLKKPRLSLSPEKSTMSYVRGGSGRLSDGVVPLTGSRLDLAPAFQKMPEGEYWLQFVPLTVPAKPLGPFHIVWNENHSAVVSNPEFRPGLYDLVLLEETGEAEGSQAWILAAEAPAYASESADFEDALKVSAQWSRDASPGALRVILRAYLESLGPAASGHSVP
jgi:hypothetical protein